MCKVEFDNDDLVVLIDALEVYIDNHRMCAEKATDKEDKDGWLAWMHGAEVVLDKISKANNDEPIRLTIAE